MFIAIGEYIDSRLEQLPTTNYGPIFLYALPESRQRKLVNCFLTNSCLYPFPCMVFPQSTFQRVQPTAASTQCLEQSASSTIAP